MDKATWPGNAVGASPPPPPDLQHYETWHDEAGYHALLHRELPEDALTYGCSRQVDAPTVNDLRQKAINNQARVWLWETAVEEL